MPYLKLTKTGVETARPEARDYELRDTTLAGFICKLDFGQSDGQLGGEVTKRA